MLERTDTYTINSPYVRLGGRHSHSIPIGGKKVFF